MHLTPRDWAILTNDAVTWPIGAMIIITLLLAYCRSTRQLSTTAARFMLIANFLLLAGLFHALSVLGAFR